MKRAGLTHGGFYLHFPSKEALAAEVSQSLLAKAARRWNEISRSPDRVTALERIVRPYLDHAHLDAASSCPLTTLGPDVARRSASREATGDALREMLEALTQVVPARKPQKAMACLSTMVGAVVLARLADDQELARAFLETAADSILTDTSSAHPKQSRMRLGPGARNAGEVGRPWGAQFKNTIK